MDSSTHFKEPVTSGRTDLARHGQRRQITVLFTDLVGSTPLAGRLDPEDFQELLVSYQQLAQQAIERYGGYTAQFLGDGVVACFGYPRAHEDDAQRAVYAGLAILDGLDEVNAGLPAGLTGSLQVRIGCHTGLVVAGAMAAGSGRDEFAMVGETPHIAARLQGVAEPGSMVISDVTEALVHGYFETEALGDRELAGVARPVRVYCVLRPSGVEDRLESVRARAPDAARRPNDGDRHVAGGVAWRAGWPRGDRARQRRAGDRQEPPRARAGRSGQRGSRLGAALAVLAPPPDQRALPVVRLLESRCRLERGEPEAAQREKLREAVLGAGLDPDESVPLLADLCRRRPCRP